MTELEHHLRNTSASKRAARMMPPDILYAGIEDYVTDKGQDFPSIPGGLAPFEQEVVREAVAAAGGMRKVSVVKQCFANAQQVVLADTSGLLTYVEGYAVGRAGVPMLHGWVVARHPSGLAVVDLTWQVSEPARKGPLRYAVLGELPERWAYHGVIFSKKTVEANVSRTGHYQSLIDDWRGGWPLLREERSTCLPAST